jgi:hypothetical protein
MRHVAWIALLLAMLWGRTEAASVTSDSTLQEPLGWAELLREEESVTFEPGRARHELQHHFLQFGSEVVAAGDSILVRNQDYGIDYSRGVLFLLQPLLAVRQLDVTYLRLPGPSQQRFRAAEIVSREEAFEAAATDVPVAEASNAAPNATRPVGLPPGLQLVGSKTIGVSFGRNREASLEQSLRVQIAGSLGDDLSVNAVLSDDNLPVVPEGNTEELGDLDRVFIEMQGPVIGGVVGDFTLGRPYGEFTRFERQLRGGEARLRLGTGELAVAAGLARGELRTATFRGIEGKQGPYELLSARRLDFSTILPGSERVLLDGELLRRGEKQGYVIDYVRGELRFTSRRRITADTEIAVDFQVSTERYRRQTRGARMGMQRGSWRLNGLFLREGDDRDHPLDGDLTPEEIALLSDSGDQPAVGPGVEVVGIGNGTYRYDAVDSTLVLYDPDAGDLDVEFYETGDGLGRYEDKLDPLTGRRFFEYRGDGLGNFDIGRLLQPPNRTQLFTAFVEGSPWKGSKLVGEASFSDFDANLFSDADDARNTGEAVDLRFDAGDVGLGFARMGFDVHVSQLSSRFQALGRTQPGFYYKEWNAEQDTLRGLERLAETTLRFGLGATPWMRAAANVGRLDRGVDLATDRAQLDVELGRSRERGVDVRWQMLDTRRPRLGPDGERTRRYARGGARYRIGLLHPEVRLERDEFVRAAADSFVRPSYRYLDSKALLGVGDQRLRATVEYGVRDTDARRSGVEQQAGAVEWVPERRNQTWGVSVVGRPTRALNTEIAWSRRTNEPLDDASPAAATQSDLARGVLSLRPPGSGWRTELRYEVSDQDVRKLEQVLVRSADGFGDYDAEGRPVGKNQGEYDKVYRFLGDVESVTQLSASWRLELGANGVGVVDSVRSWVRRNISMVQVLSVQEQTRLDDRRLYFLHPAAFQGDQTLFGSFRARQEWSFLNASRDNSVRLFLSWEDDIDGRFGDARVDSRRGLARLQYQRTSRSPWGWGGESEFGHRDRRGALSAVVPGRDSSDSFSIRLLSALARLGYRLSANERLTTEVRATHQRDALSTTSQQLVEFTPGVVLAPVRNVRLFASLSATRILEFRPEGALPPFLFDPPGTKTTATLTGSYRLGRHLNLNLTYSGIRNTDGRSTYDVKAETRAIF